MLVKPVQLTPVGKNQNQNKNNENVSFQGAGNAAVLLMDAIDRGGFAASFIVQDFLGMAAPRIGAGMYRNHDQTGQLNWDFAKKEGIREILSGPSTFIIPAAMMYGIKKVSGKANNVPVKFIDALGETFTKYATNNKTKPNLANLAETRQGVYTEYFKNILSTSTNSGLVGKELDATATSFAKRAIQAENAKSKGFWKTLIGKPVAGSSQDLRQGLQDDFVAILKKHNGANGSKTSVRYTTEKGKKVSTSFKNMLDFMSDYTDDALKTVNRKLNSVKDLNVEKFVKKLNKRRAGTRFVSNLAMYSGIVAFYTIIPKIYNMATKGRDPGLDGLNTSNTGVNKQPKVNTPVVKVEKQSESEKHLDIVESSDNTSSDNKKDVAFTGKMTLVHDAMANLGTRIKKPGILNKFSEVMEFEGSSLSMPAMLTLLFGFCLPPRLKNAQSQTDKKEILFRDVTSFVSILFGAKAITRVCSDVFSKQSGLALNTKPADHNSNIFKKAWHYIYPSGGVNVLDSESIVANYSKVDNFKNGINDMFKFVNENGGNVGKMLSLDPEICEEATKILGKKPDASMKFKDIDNAFKVAKEKGSEELKKILKILSNENNNIVKRAKSMNSAFGALSTVLLVPALMMWISKHCEKMTKERIAEQQKQAQAQAEMSLKMDVAVLTDKPTMAGFLNR